MRKRVDSGNEMDSEVLWKKSGGTKLYGHAAEMVFEFLQDTILVL